MKNFKFILVIMVMTSFLFSCDEDKDKEEEEVQRTTHTVTLKNESGVNGCGIGPGFQITYVVSYRDIQVDATINDGTFGIINVLVEDGERINVKVYSTEDDMLFADANVNVRTTTRPEFLESEFRTVTYCEAFNLIFENF